MPRRRKNDLDGIVPIDNKVVAKERRRKKIELIIGGVLLVLIITGGVIVALQNKKMTPKVAGASTSSEIEALKAEIDNLNKKIDNLNKNIELAKAAGVETTTTESGSSGKSSSETPSGRININTASLSELDSLPGIGPTYAQRIIDYRNANGGFKSTDELKNVKGIGDKTFEKFKDSVTM